MVYGYRPMPCHRTLVLALLLAIAAMEKPAHAQRTCPNAPILSPTTEKNIFTPQQEVDLGDVEAEQFERNVHVIRDADLSAYANRVAERIVAHLPPSGLRIRIILIDLPIVNAFSIAGGRIYVTRKAIAFVRNEDELAGLLGHEMGHALTHQQAVDVTRLLHDVLGVTEVGDRKDIFEKFNRFLDNAARNPKAFERGAREEEPHQYEADQVSLYAVAQAGYSSEAFVSFFDRLAQTQGKTGNWLSDFIGMTKPNEKRLRQLHKTLDDVPAACRVAAPSPSEAFLRWQASIIAFSDLGRDESLAGVLERKNLDPPLRTDVTRLRFSPDGRYVLAQDEASIFIFTREPFEVLLRIDARDARPAQFTPDSQGVVFSTRGMRVEKWSIPESRRIDVHELALPGGCIQTVLSYDGKTIACLDEKFTISLLDVASGNPVFTKKEYFRPQEPISFAELMMRLLALIEELNGGDILQMSFSPDDRYFVAGLFHTTLAVDMTTHATVPLHGGLPSIVGWGFVFLAPDRVIGVNRAFPDDSGVFEFPSGRLVQRFRLGGEHLQAPTRGNEIIVKPLKDAPAGGLVDLQTKKILFELEFSSAVDVYDQAFVLERKSGDIALCDLATLKVKAELALPRSPLGSLRTWNVSPDFKWLAVSGETRGAVWDLSNSKRLYLVRGFHGAYFDDKNLYADFPKLDKQERTIGRLDLQRQNISVGPPIAEKTQANQYGPYVLVRIPQNKNGSNDRNVTLEIRDVRDNHVLWTRNFPKDVPRITMNLTGETTFLEWSAEAGGAQDEIKSDPVIKTRFDAMRDRKAAYLLEVLDSSNGKVTGRLLVDTGNGSFRIKSVTTSQDWLLVADRGNRIHVYSISSGVEKGIVFGSSALLSPTGETLIAENEPGQLDVYALPTLEKRIPLIFQSPVSAESFSSDGKRLFVLTANQTAYVLDTTAMGHPASTAAK